MSAIDLLKTGRLRLERGWCTGQLLLWTPGERYPKVCMLGALLPHETYTLGLPGADEDTDDYTFCEEEDVHEALTYLLAVIVPGNIRAQLTDPMYAHTVYMYNDQLHVVDQALETFDAAIASAEEEAAATVPASEVELATAGD